MTFMIFIVCHHAFVFQTTMSYFFGDPTFAPAMISRAIKRVRVRVMIGFLVQGRVRIKIRIRVRVRVGVTFNVSVYHRSNCHRSKCRTFILFFKTSAIFCICVILPLTKENCLDVDSFHIHCIPLASEI